MRAANQSGSTESSLIGLGSATNTVSAMGREIGGATRRSGADSTRGIDISRMGPGGGRHPADIAREQAWRDYPG